MKKALFLLILIFTFNISFALMIDDAIKVAMENNETIKISKEKLKYSNAKILESFSGFLPQLNSQFTWNRNDQMPSMKYITKTMVVGTKVVTATTGMDFVYEMKNTYDGKLTFQQPLFTGGKLLNGLRISLKNKEVSEYDLQKTKLQLVYDVKKAFYSVLLAKEMLKVAKEAYDQAERHAKKVQDMYEQGISSKFDSLRANVQLSSAKPNLIKAENGLKLAQSAFNLTLGLNPESECSIEGELSYNFENENKDFNAKEYALSNRPELKMMDIQEKISKIAVSLAIGNYFPTLALVANYGKSKGSRMIDSSSGSGWMDGWSDAWAIVGNVSFPIFDASRVPKILSANSNLKQVQITKEQLKKGIMLEIDSTMLQMNEAKEIIASAEESVKQAEESLKIAQVSYKNGVITNLELMDTQTMLTQVKMQYAQAVFGYIDAKAKLDKAVGKLEMK